MQLLQHILIGNFAGDSDGDMLCPIIRLPVLGRWEHTLFSDRSLSIYLANIVCWHRYINDIFMVWNLNEDELKVFMNMLATNNLNLKFTMKYNQ